MPDVEILDTTLRDGGYEVDFDFSEEDTVNYAALLDQAGFRYIEVGHGAGVGCRRWSRTSGMPLGVFDDEVHMRAAAGIVKNAKVGVLLIGGDGFAPVDTLDRVADCGMDFVRLAFDPTEFRSENFTYIDRAKALGLTVGVNLMQTSEVSPSVVAEGATECASRGSEWFSIVDSAGGMTPESVAAYVESVGRVDGLRIGFHSHNNRFLAVANCMAAVRAGATMIDGTLNGIGRGPGNPPTELLVLALQELGHEQQIDLGLTVRLGRSVRRFIAEKGLDPISFVSGAAMLHSRNCKAYVKAAREAGKDPTEAILVGSRLSSKAGTRAWAPSAELMQQVLDGISPEKDWIPPGLRNWHVRRLRTASRPLEEDFADLAARAARVHKHSIVHLAPQHLGISSPTPWESARFSGLTIAEGQVSLEEINQMGEVNGVPRYVVHQPTPNAPTGALFFPCPLEEILRDSAMAIARARGHQDSIGVSEHLAKILGGILRQGPFVLLEDGQPLPPVVLGDRSLLERTEALAETELVLLTGPAAPADRKVIDSLRARGILVLRPYLPEVVAAKISCLESARQALTLQEGQHLTVPISVVPGSFQAVVDDHQTPSVFAVDPEDRKRDDLIGALAESAIRPLLR